jgi:hypothetical protein
VLTHGCDDRIISLPSLRSACWLAIHLNSIFQYRQIRTAYFSLSSG